MLRSFPDWEECLSIHRIPLSHLNAVSGAKIKMQLLTCSNSQESRILIHSEAPPQTTTIWHKYCAFTLNPGFCVKLHLANWTAPPAPPAMRPGFRGPTLSSPRTGPGVGERTASSCSPKVFSWGAPADCGPSATSGRKCSKKKKENHSSANSLDLKLHASGSRL